MSKDIQRENVTTGLDFPGFKIIKSFGIVRGITVRSRNICVDIAAVLCACKGGKNTLITHLCEVAREEAYELMLREASHTGANAIIGFRYDAVVLGGGMTEVLAYGTAVTIDIQNSLVQSI